MRVPAPVPAVPFVLVPSEADQDRPLGLSFLVIVTRGQFAGSEWLGVALANIPSRASSGCTKAPSRAPVSVTAEAQRSPPVAMKRVHFWEHTLQV